MNEQQFDDWLAEFGEHYFEHAGALPLIVRGTDPQSDLKVMSHSSRHRIVWFWYPLQQHSPDYWNLVLLGTYAHAFRCHLSTANQISELLGIPVWERNIPDIWLFSVENPLV